MVPVKTLASRKMIVANERPPALNAEEILKVVDQELLQRRSSMSIPICSCRRWDGWGYGESTNCSHITIWKPSCSGRARSSRTKFPAVEAAKADAIWKALFVENTPVSEATRA